MSAIPYAYGAAMSVATLMLMCAGILYGVPRRTAEVVRNIPGSEFSFSAAIPIFMIFGILALLAILSGVLFVGVSVGSLLFGGRLSADDDGGEPIHAVELRGTFALCLIFLGVFVAVYVLNWYLLTQLWAIGA